MIDPVTSVIFQVSLLLRVVQTSRVKRVPVIAVAAPTLRGLCS